MSHRQSLEHVKGIKPFVLYGIRWEALRRSSGVEEDDEWVELWKVAAKYVSVPLNEDEDLSTNA